MQSFDKLLGQIIDETTSRSKGQQTQKGDIIAVGTSNVKLNLESISQAVKNILSKAIKPAIIEGLNVVATVPPSMKVYIYPGYGTSGGEIHELYDRVTATISPYIELQYINLKGARVTVDTSPVRGSLGLAKIAVPKPPYTNKILDDMNPASDYDGYIISGKDILFNNNFLIDDESIPVIRNTMSKIFAEYIFGTITLSEALKIANVQGTMMANSNSITFYDTNGAELAYYGAREARIGNIKITPTTVQSRNFQAGSRGFQLKDDGNAEFDNITARGTIYADAGDIGDILINSGDIQTSNYIADSAGFKLNSNGNAEFNDLKARGTIYASGGDIGDILINSGDIQTSNYVTGVSGFKLNSNGNAEFSDIIARGDIYANSGYFSGTVYAQAGDITGNLYVGTGSPRIIIDGVAKTIGTTDFASGYNGRGWRIDADGSITMQNGLFRGELHTSVFVKDEVHVTNGNLMVTNGSVIASGVDSGDTDIYINQGVFSVNDIIRLKNDTNSEYMQVTGVTGANDTKITVTRNLDATGANDWEQGECVASLGSRINIAASGDITRSGFSGTEGYLPYVDVIRRNSTTWNDETVMVRMGNLTGVTHPLFGNLSGYGLFAQNVYLSGTMTASTIQTTNAANLGLKLTETGIKAWDSGNNQRVQILNDGSGWIGESEGKGISWTNAGKLTVSGTVGTTVIDGGNISTNSILITKLASDTTNRLFTDSTTKGNIEAWRHASDATLIDGGDIYTNTITVAKMNADATDRLFTDSTTRGNVEGWKHASDATLIDGGDIYTNTVTATQISVANLAAINADLGSITAGTVTGAIIQTHSAINSGTKLTANALTIYGLNSLLFKNNIGDNRGRIDISDGLIIQGEGDNMKISSAQSLEIEVGGNEDLWLFGTSATSLIRLGRTTTHNNLIAYGQGAFVDGVAGGNNEALKWDIVFHDLDGTSGDTEAYSITATTIRDIAGGILNVSLSKFYGSSYNLDHATASGLSMHFNSTRLEVYYGSNYTSGDDCYWIVYYV